MEIIFMIQDELHRDEPKLREDFVAGCGRVDDSDTEAICYAISEIEEKEDIDEMFTYGVIAAFSFISVPEGEDMHGASFEEFMANAWKRVGDRKVIEEFLGKVMGGTR